MLLARTARDAVNATPGVTVAAGGAGRWVTADRRGSVFGVVASAVPGGRYEMDLHLTLGWPPPPLERLGDEVRRVVREACREQGLDDALAAINVRVDAVEDPAEASDAAG